MFERLTMIKILNSYMKTMSELHGYPFYDGRICTGGSWVRLIGRDMKSYLPINHTTSIYYNDISYYKRFERVAEIGDIVYMNYNEGNDPYAMARYVGCKINGRVVSFRSQQVYARDIERI